MKYLIGLIALLLPTYLIRFNIGGIPTTLLEIIIYLIFLIGLFRIGYSQLFKIKKTIWLTIGVLLFAVLISVFVSPLKATALGQFKAFFIDPILVFWLITCYLEPKDFRFVVYGLGLSSLFISIYSIIQKLSGNITSDGRVVGIFGYSPNFVALYLTPIIVFLICYGIVLFKQKKYILTTVIGLVTLINLIGLYLSGSRSGLLGVGAGIVFFLILNFWDKIKEKLYLKTSILLLIILAILGSFFAFKPNFEATEGRVVSSSNVRWQIWQTSVEMIGNHPILGVGLGNYQNAFTELTSNRANFQESISPLALSAHNIFLMFYLSTGLLGFLVFVWLLIIFYRKGFKEIRNDWSKILLAAMTALILQGMVDMAYFKNDLSLIFWLIFGFMMLLREKR